MKFPLIIIHIMKILAFILFLVVALQGLEVMPPQPNCRVAPLPAILPVSIGETVKFDLESIIGGIIL